MAPEKAVDKKTIGITSANERGYTFCAGYRRPVCLRDRGCEVRDGACDPGRDTARGTTEGASTKWNVGSVDSDGALKAVIEALFAGEGQPYRLVEHLMNAGLRLLDKGNALPPDVAAVLLATEA